MGMPPLAYITTEHVREYLAHLSEKGNKPATIHARYRALNRFFKWCVQEGERKDNPMDRINPPRLPDLIQPHYRDNEIMAVLKACNDRSIFGLRDAAIIFTLYDTGVRAAELCGMQIADIDWKELTVLVRGKAGKERQVSFGHKTATTIDRYLRKRRQKSPILWLAYGSRALNTNGLRMMLRRRFSEAGVAFRGAHGFRRAFAMAYLASGGQEGDLKELAGWSDYSMVARYAKATAGERAIKAHKKLSPGDRLNAR
jgi:site-specific recombinase XerD